MRGPRVGEGVADGDDDVGVEPPVPAGLGALTAPQQALADFLRVDPDLLAAARRPARICLRRHLIRIDPCLSQRGDFSVSEVPQFGCMTC